MAIVYQHRETNNVILIKYVDTYSKQSLILFCLQEEQILVDERKKKATVVVMSEVTITQLQ